MVWYSLRVWISVCVWWLVVHARAGIPQSSTISYQVHSYNDLREWPQILRKGTVYFKVDPHFMDSSFCASQPQAPQSPEGCFVLSHDMPVTERQYNTTYSILNFISDPQYAAYYKNPVQKIHIALCFKLDNASPCDGSVVAQNWTSTTQAFFDTANAVVSAKGLNVEFILDGSSTPTDQNLCLINKWRPWVATWIPGDSEEAPYSNNATFGLDRFQVFNPPVTLGVPAYYIDIWKLQDYGKFSQSNYSYLIWEPADQEPVLDISDSYLGGPLHALDFRFAINIDPVQLQVFAATRSGTGWNNEIASGSSSVFGSPALAVVASPNSQSFYIITTFIDSKTGLTYYTVNTAPTWDNTQLGPITSTPPQPMPGDASPVTSLSTLSGTTIYGSKPNGNFAIYSFNESAQALMGGVTGQLASCSDCKSVAFTSGNNAYVAQLINGNTSCSMQLQIWQLENSEKASKLGPANCVQNSVQIAYFDVSIFGSSQGESFCSAGELPGVLMFSDTSNNIYTSVLCLNINTGAVEVNGGEGSGVAVDVGSETSVSLYTFNGQLMVLEVHADGFCWNSEPNNKQPTPATCSNTPTSIQYILNYNFGSFDDWATHVMNIINHKNQSYLLDSIFSSCHPTILHGAYDSGSSPRVGLFSASYNSAEVLLHAEVHVGLPKKYNNTSECGFAISREGSVVLDSWLLTTWTET
eukprot:Phypoly_transcript_04426.p1 GENE.Phypoly_transcript_04426~~Phypoly_transcript_04426.p1  ORF type:complete len:695 (+),score=81.70 Phypoly_transcript_04426:80-2164(+)